MTRLPLVVLLFLLSWVTGTASAGAAPLRVFVSIPPQATFVRQVGGERVRVDILVRPGQSPATYAPTPKQMTALTQTDLYFRIGVPFERSLIPRLTRQAPSLEIVDLRNILNQSEKDEAIGRDPHIWLDPNLVHRMVLLIRDRLSRNDPAGAARYQTNCARFQEQLTRLDQELHRLLAPVRGQTLTVFHPAYGWFCRAYGLRQRAVIHEGKLPGPRALARLIEETRHRRTRYLVIQPQFSRRSAQSVARAMEARLVEMDPLAEDYLDNMIRMGQTIARILTPRPVSHER